MICIAQSKNFHQRGVMLIECVVYCTVLIVLFGLGLSAYFRCLDAARRLQQNADDVAQTLNAGERWREDIRQARQVIVSENSVSIVQTNTAVTYWFATNMVWRHTEGRAPARILSNVKSSRMEGDSRTTVEAMRWEVELLPRQKTVRLRPLFTFLAVPNAPLE